MKRFIITVRDDDCSPVPADVQYLVVNVDEPYADSVRDLMGESEKLFFIDKFDKSGNLVPSRDNHLVVSTNEPYAERVFELIRDSEKAKGTWDSPDDFETFCKELRNES